MTTTAALSYTPDGNDPMMVDDDDSSDEALQKEQQVQKRKRTIEALSRNIREYEPHRWFSFMLAQCCRVPRDTWRAPSCSGRELCDCSGAMHEDDEGCIGNGLIDDNFLQWQKELAALPQEEQDQIHRDVYGENPLSEETPELIQTKLAALRQVISATNANDKEVYLEAVEQAKALRDVEGTPPDMYYVLSDDFHLMFLRAVDWDTIQAAHRMVHFMEIKLQLWGPNKLSKRITLDDLSEDDKKAAASCGNFCGTDKAGPALHFIRHQKYKYKDLHSLMRGVYYVRMHHLENSLQMQQMGIVSIFYNVGHYPRDCREAMMRAAPGMSKLHSIGPFKIVAIHHCHNNFVEREVWGVLRILFPSHIRKIYHRIIGSDQECLLKLMTYGIPVEQLNHAGWYPIGTDDGRNDEYDLFPKKKSFLDGMEENDTQDPSESHEDVNANDGRE